MILFALCLNPLLYYLDERLQGIRVTEDNSDRYTDDVSGLVTSKEDVRIIHDAITCYEKATGAKLNIAKSSVLAVDNWDPSCDVMGIPYKK